MGAGGIELWRLKNQQQQLDPTGTYTAGIDPLKEHELLRNILQSLQQQPVMPPMQSGGMPFAPITSQPGTSPPMGPPMTGRTRMPVYSPAPTGPMSQMAYQMAGIPAGRDPMDILRTIQPARRAP